MRSIVLLALAPLAMGFAPAFSPALAPGEALMAVRAMPSSALPPSFPFSLA